jgi:tetratricopeptide (TPR) repeat protein
MQRSIHRGVPFLKLRAFRDRLELVLARVLVLAGSLILPLPALAGRAGDVRLEAFQLLNEGVSAYSRGNPQEAVDKLGRCVALSLNSFRAHYYYGLALSAVRRHAEAVEVLTFALDLEPEDLQALVALGHAELARGDVDEARAGYARALKIRLDYAPALDGLARSYEARGQDEEAVERYRRAIQADKGYAPAYTHLGDLYLRQDRVREAVTLLEEAVVIRPDFAEGLNRLAVAYGRLGLFNEAVASVQRAIELEPQEPSHLETLGWLQLDQSALSAADASFHRALALTPASPKSRLGLAEIERRRGDYVAALAQLDLALALPELDAAMASELAEVRAAFEVERQRIADIEARVASGSAAPEDHAARAEILARRGHWGEAAEELRQAPPSAENDEWLAFLLFQDGRYREAHALYARLAGEQDRSDLQLNAGVALSRLGDDLGASAVFDGILARDTSQSWARLYLANAQLRLGRLEPAAASYRAYLDLDPRSEPAERVRRILRQIAPDLVPAETVEPLALPPPVPPPQPPPEEE